MVWAVVAAEEVVLSCVSDKLEVLLEAQVSVVVDFLSPQLGGEAATLYDMVLSSAISLESWYQVEVLVPEKSSR